MAASQTAANAATFTLTANTNASINLTGRYRKVEIVHHGNVTDVVRYATAATEALLPTLAGGITDDEYPLLSGERLMVNQRGDGIWVALRCAGAATVSVVGVE